MQDMALMQWLVAAHKLKPPVRQVVWLGIKVDLNENTVSILPKKFKDPARLGRPIAPTGTESSPPSHWTKINHLATVIKPSHVFMGKLLTLLVQVVLAMLQWEGHYTPRNMEKRDVGGYMCQGCKGS